MPVPSLHHGCLIELEAVAASYELAWRMQANAPDVLDLAKETAETLKLYGVNQKATDTFVLRRVRPIIEGKFYNDFGFRFTPDFGSRSEQRAFNSSKSRWPESFLKSAILTAALISATVSLPR